MSVKLLMSVTVYLLTAAGGASAQVSVDWAGTSSAPATSSILGAPDGTVVTLGTGGTTLGSFGGTTSYSNAALASLLGISLAALQPNQVLAFEYNGGGAPAGSAWETSDWTFFDGSNTRIARFDELTGALDPGNSSIDVTLVARGSFSASIYNAFFAITPSLPDSAVSFVLFQLQTSIDSSNPAFTVHVAGVSVQGQQGSPDPDAIGVIRSIPTPGATALLGLGGLVAARRRR